MRGVKFKREKDSEKAKGARPSSTLSAAAPILGKRDTTAAGPAAPASKVASKRADDQAAQTAERPELRAEAATGNPRKKQKVEEPAPEALSTEAREQEGNPALEDGQPLLDGKGKTRASLGAALAQTEGAVPGKDLPEFPGAGEPAVPFHEGLTKASEDERLVQLLRHICRHEQKAVDETYKDHQFVIGAAETVMRGWVRAVQKRLKEDPAMVDMSQSLVAGSSPGEGRANLEDEEEERREALLTQRNDLLREEQWWQRIIASQEAIPEPETEARAQAPEPEPSAIESVGLDAAGEETRRKLVFQVEALCQLVSGVSELCRRTEQASKDLAEDFGAKVTSSLPQGSPRTLIKQFMSHHPASGPS